MIKILTGDTLEYMIGFGSISGVVLSSFTLLDIKYFKVVHGYGSVQQLIDESETGELGTIVIEADLIHYVSYHQITKVYRETNRSQTIEYNVSELNNGSYYFSRFSENPIIGAIMFSEIFSKNEINSADIDVFQVYKSSSVPKDDGSYFIHIKKVLNNKSKSFFVSSPIKFIHLNTLFLDKSKYKILRKSYTINKSADKIDLDVIIGK